MQVLRRQPHPSSACLRLGTRNTGKRRFGRVTYVMIGIQHVCMSCLSTSRLETERDNARGRVGWNRGRIGQAKHEVT